MAFSLPKKGVLSRFRSTQGVSLIELMVAAGLLLGLALAIVYLFGSSTKGLQRARQTSARDTNYMNVGRLAADPMSLLNSYNAAVANTGYNPCLHSDANGGSTPSVGGCAPYLLASSTATLTPSGSSSFTPNRQFSRDPDTNQALWFPMTLYDNQQTNSLAVAGPYPDIPSTAFNSRPNIRYTRDGKRCEYRSDEAALKRICPVEALSFYSGVCRDNAANCQKFSRYLVHVRFNFDDGSNQPPPQDDIHLLRLLNTVSEVSCSTLGLAACPALSGTDTSVQWNFISTSTTTSIGTGSGTGVGGGGGGTTTGTGGGTDPGTGTGAGTGTGTGTGAGTGTGTGAGGASGPATVSKIEPANGPNTGGTVVGLTGTNFVDGMTIQIGSKTCTNIAVRSSTQATCITPSGMWIGVNDVDVMNALGGGTLATGFTAYAPIASTTGRQVSLKMANLSYSGFTPGIGTAARVSQPQSPVTDSSGNIYYRELKNAVIKKVTPAGVVTVVAGIQGSEGLVNGGVGVSKIYGKRRGYGGCMAHDQASTLYFLDDGGNNQKGLRKLDTTTNTVSTIATDISALGYWGWWNHQACTLLYSGGALFLKGDHPKCGIFRIDATTGATTLVAGNGSNICGYVDGDGTAAQFAGQADSMTALGSHIYISDRSGNIRKMMNTAPYTVTSLFNASASPYCTEGDINTAKMGSSGGALTNNGTDLYFIQTGDCQRVGKISLSPVNVTHYPSLYVGQNECGGGNQLTCDGATNNSGQPQTSIASSGGAIYAFTETFDAHRLRKYDVASTPPQMQTFIGKASHAWPGVVGSAGGGGGRFHGTPARALAWDGTYLYGSFQGFGNRGQMILRFNPATNAFSQFSTFGWQGDDPSDMAFDGFKLYYASRCAIYTLDRTTGVSTIVAGAQDTCGTATDGIGTAARFQAPTNVTTDGQFLYISDALNCCNGTIRKMNLKTLEVTSTAVNEGQYYFRMHYHQGKVYFTPWSGALLKAFDVATGTVTSIAGNLRSVATPEGYKDTGDHAIGTNASFGEIRQITSLGSDLLVADEHNGTLRKVTLSGTNAVSTFAGSDRYFEDIDGLFPSSSTSATFFEPAGVLQTSHGIWVLNRTGLRLIY